MKNTLAEAKRLAKERELAIHHDAGFAVSAGRDHPELTALMVFGCWYRSKDWPDRAVTRKQAVNMLCAALRALPKRKSGGTEK